MLNCKETAAMERFLRISYEIDGELRELRSAAHPGVGGDRARVRPIWISGFGSWNRRSRTRDEEEEENDNEGSWAE